MTETFALSVFAALAVTAAAGALALTVLGVVATARAVADARLERALANRYLHRKSGTTQPERRATQ